MLLMYPMMLMVYGWVGEGDPHPPPLLPYYPKGFSSRIFFTLRNIQSGFSPLDL